MSSILKEITEAEKKIEEFKEKAHKKAAKMVLDAEATSKEVIEAKSKELSEKNKSDLEKIAKTLEKEKNKKVDEAKKISDKLSGNSDKKSEKAVSFVYEEFLKSLK